MNRRCRTAFIVALASALVPGADVLAQKRLSPLIGDPWHIEDITGHGVIDKSPENLLFTPDGKLTGHGTCNRIFAAWTESEGALVIEDIGATKKLCAPALMTQEQRLLTALSRVTGYAFNDTGALILHTADGKTITARQ
ncbi:META domain-containing protein [Oceaniovalibus sp. ACAM 378]|uniref:META domain-containing protein n=1 Tax=Oceaniovalibus sp. ACAM 378 TaxID=2599923 RepID=UPI0011D34589|nr:META domain-containing protein [Oceaniovalibus sp. ACAM 378]TYB90269.1 META domain-containing protein [Oceaniovalibus sp. ACAM 378]